MYKYQPSNAKGTRSTPATPHHLQHLTAFVIQNLKIEKEEKEFTLSSLTTGFDRFPTYCDIFQETHTTLLSGNGPLPEATRHFIARMVNIWPHTIGED